MSLKSRKMVGIGATGVFMFATILAVLILVILIFEIVSSGYKDLDWKFITSPPSVLSAEKAGIWPALMGSIWLMALTAVISIPVGIGAAIYLEELTVKNKLTRIIEVNISNLAGVPSIVYGILGLGIFVRQFHMGRSVLAGALTMSLLILPVIIVSAREALKAVPDSIRQAAYGLGATKIQTIWHHVLPAAVPGIVTGIILALSRAVGETAPIAMIGALSYIHDAPKGVMSSFTALPLQIYNWISYPQKEFHEIAGAAILVLLILLLTMNSIAITIRQRFERNRQW
ncbi:MAG: phosphate ABC transporter permease PstA [Planctomycetes bacterium]|nr:phosphate ABC transporter permease PstA [Planctomycetota bacterium]